MTDGTEEYVAPTDDIPAPVELDEHGNPVGIQVSTPFEEPAPITITDEQKKLMDEDPFNPAKLIEDGKYVAPQDEEVYSVSDEYDLGAALFSLISRALEHTEDQYIVDNATHVRDLLAKASVPTPVQTVQSVGLGQPVSEDTADALIDLNQSIHTPPQPGEVLNKPADVVMDTVIPPQTNAPNV